MVQKIKFVLFFSVWALAQPSFAVNKTLSRYCSALLGVPEAHAPAFAQYTDPRFLTPMIYVDWQPVAEVKEGAGSGFFEISSLPKGYVDAGTDPDRQAQKNLKIRVEYRVGIAKGKQWAEMEIHDFPREIDTEYGYRLVASHLSSRFPDLNVIRFVILPNMPDYAIMTGLLATGVKATDALQRIPSVRAFSDFGFVGSRRSPIGLTEPDFSSFQGSIDLVVVFTKKKPGH